MKKTALTLLTVVLTAGAAFAQAPRPDAKGCQDHLVFNRMPDYWIRSCDVKEFEAHEFQASATQKQTVEGRVTRLNYLPQAALAAKPSQLQIQRNFESAVTRLGGKVVYTTKGISTMRLTKDGQEIWVDLRCDYTSSYTLWVLEQQGMVQAIEVSAAALANDLKTTGHVTVEGIYFDTGKAEIKPESAKAIMEIAKLLAAEPALKVYVVGHTDTVGVLDANMKLSQDRAAAVLQALVTTHGIAATRLKSFGAGPYAPVSSNDADAGRARNRRVELVKQ